MNRKIFRRFFAILGGRIGSLLLSLITTPIIVRLIDVSEYGTYAVIISSFGLITMITDAGFFDAIRKYITEDRDYNNWQRDIYRFYARIAVFVAVLAAITVIVAAHYGVTNAILGISTTNYFVLLSIMLLTRQLFLIMRGVLMGFKQERVSESLTVVRRTLILVVGAGLLYVGWGVSGLLIGHIAAEIVTLLVATFVASKYLPILYIFSFHKVKLPRKELLSFNINSVVLSILFGSLYHVDILLLQYFSSSTLTGYYKAALVLAGFIGFVPVAIQILFVHSTSHLWTDQKNEQISIIASKTTRYVALLTSLLAIGISALAANFIPLYFGANFTPAITPLLVLLPGAVGLAISRPIVAMGQAKGQFTSMVYATGIAAVINLLGNFVLIPRFGMLGAAMATSIGYGSMLFLQIYSARKVGFNPTRDLRIIPIVTTILISSPIIIFISNLISSNIISLLIIPPTGFCIYVAVAFIVGAAEKDELYNAIRD